MSSSTVIDPRSKMAVFIVTCLTVFSGLSLGQEIAITVLISILLLICGKYRYSFLLCGLYAFLLIIDLWAAPLFSGTLRFAMLALARLGRFMLPVIAAAYLVMQTVKISECISALTAMHMPGTLVIPLAVMLRFLPTMQEEWIAINQAMKMRGMAFSLKNILKQPITTLEHMLIPFLMSASAITEELAAASMARGLDKDRRRTSYSRVKLGFVDGAILAVILIYITSVWL